MMLTKELHYRLILATALLMGSLVFLTATGQIYASVGYFGVTGDEVTRISDTGHNVQIWEILPEYTILGDYEVSIKHAVAGDIGSFYIIVWADTNNDGRPDTEISRSDLKTARYDGEWSSWRFTSHYDRIFVGNTWSRSDENVYYQSGGSLEGYTGLSNTVFFSRRFNGEPNQRRTPRYTNIRVRPLQERSDAGVEYFGVTGDEVTRISDTGHNVQIWEILPEYTILGDYEVSIKHAVAGNIGSFYIIAWADTNNDGRPDTEISRSDLKTARYDGEWSSWRFTSHYDRIFVGNTWSRSDENVYYQSGGSLEGYTGLSNTVFFSRRFNGEPNQRRTPRYTNIRLRTIK